jgi:hypothetical protein
LLAAVDWQFGVVTVAAAWSAWRLVRPFVARSQSDPAVTCSHCPTGGGGCGSRQAPTLVTLGAARRPPAS